MSEKHPDQIPLDNSGDKEPDIDSLIQPVRVTPPF